MLEMKKIVVTRSNINASGDSYSSHRRSWQRAVLWFHSADEHFDGAIEVGANY